MSTNTMEPKKLTANANQWGEFTVPPSSQE